MVVYATRAFELSTTLGLKNCRSLLSPTSSGFIISEAQQKIQSHDKMAMDMQFADETIKDA